MLDAAPFRLLGHDYRIRGISQNDRVQIWEGLRTVAPHLLVLVPVEGDAAFEPFIIAMSAALLKMSGVDRPMVVSACLASIERRHVLRWRPVWDRKAGRLLYDDITLDLFTALTMRVLCRVVMEHAAKSPAQLREEVA